MASSEAFSPLFEAFSPVSPDEWRAQVRADLGDTVPDDLLTWSSIEGVTMPAYLWRQDLADVAHLQPDSAQTPLARGDKSPANDWRIRHSITHPDPEPANEQAREAVDGGAADLGLALPSAELKGTGPALASIADVATVLNGIDLTETALHLGRGPSGAVLYAALPELLGSRDLDLQSVRGSVEYDPVAALASGSMASASAAFDLAESLVTDLGAAPPLRSATIDARVYHDAGASAVQELTFSLGALSDTLARATDRGIALRTLLDALQVIVPVSTSFFVEIGKLRALRLLVPQVVEAFAGEADVDLAYGPSDLFVQVETSRRTETAYDPKVNMLRATTEAMAAVLGGCDVLSVRPYDVALRPPDSFAARIARNTQLILKHEGHLDRVADPAAGSYYVESLTDALAQQAWTAFQDLEANGGLLVGLRDGSVQHAIRQTRRERREAVDTGNDVLVGTTNYPDLDERRLNDLRAQNGAPLNNTGETVDLQAASIPFIRQALRDGASLPALVASLRIGTSSIDPLPSVRLAAPIESIRLRTERAAEDADGPPSVLLVPMGPPAARSARATFARNVLGVAGFESHEPLAFDTATEAAEAVVDTGADAVVLCSADTEYPSLLPTLRTALAKHDRDPLLIVAGPPEALDEDASADFFLHQERSLKDTLETLQARLGIPTRTEA